MMADYEITTDDAEVERLTANGDAHTDLSIMMKYPPFSVYEDKRNSLRDAMMEASEEIALEMNKTDKAPENGYAKVMQKFANDIEEARLYQKRYGSNWREAQKAAMKIDDIKEDFNGLYSEFD